MKIRSNIHEAAEVWAGRRVSYQIGTQAEKVGTLTGEHKPLSRTAIKMQVQPDDGARKVWVTWAWAVDDAPATDGDDRCAECGDFLDWCPRSGLTAEERTAMRESREG